jgi:rubrerythrin
MEERIITDKEAEGVVGGFDFTARDFGVHKKFVLCKNCKKTAEVEPGEKSCPFCGAELV